MFNKSLLATVFAIALYGAYVFAYEKHHHATQHIEIKKSDSSSVEAQALEKINLEYQNKVKAIFQSKCMNCHSTQTEYPFYYNWPFAKKLIDDDIAESKKHLDMTNDFPFSGHGTPAEYLEAINKVTSKGSMPPMRYRIMHWASGLTNVERKTISTWVNESLNLLRTPR